MSRLDTVLGDTKGRMVPWLATVTVAGRVAQWHSARLIHTGSKFAPPPAPHKCGVYVPIMDAYSLVLVQGRGGAWQV